jgi:hypothetical protein
VHITPFVDNCCRLAIYIQFVVNIDKGISSLGASIFAFQMIVILQHLEGVSNILEQHFLQWE